MFDTVLGHTEVRRRIGTGALISIAFHAALLTGGLWLSARAIQAPAQAGPIIKFWPGAAAGKRLGGGTAAAPAAPKHSAPKHTMAPPTHVPPQLPAEQMVKDTTPSPAALMGEKVSPSGEVDAPPGEGDPSGTCSGPECAKEGTGPGPGSGDGVATQPAPTVMVPGMTQPVLLSGPTIQMTSDALAARVQGSMLVRCALTVEGAVTECSVIKSLPFMDETVLRALQARRYKPVTFEGKAVSVWYIFNLRFTQP
jgi:protein TonB